VRGLGTDGTDGAGGTEVGAAAVGGTEGSV
jgi:hypothetical protein